MCVCVCVTSLPLQLLQAVSGVGPAVERCRDAVSPVVLRLVPPYSGGHAQQSHVGHVSLTTPTNSPHHDQKQGSNSGVYTRTCIYNIMFCVCRRVRVYELYYVVCGGENVPFVKCSKYIVLPKSVDKKKTCDPFLHTCVCAVLQSIQQCGPTAHGRCL